VEAGLARRAGAGAANHFDHETVAFHERVRAAYRELAAESPDVWRIIDAAQPFDAVLAEARAAITKLLEA
jgi:dTMP kinase